MSENLTQEENNIFILTIPFYQQKQDLTSLECDHAEHMNQKF